MWFLFDEFLKGIFWGFYLGGARGSGIQSNWYCVMFCTCALYFFFCIEKLKFCRTIFKGLCFRMMTSALSKRSQSYQDVILLNDYKPMYKFLNILLFWVHQNFCSQPSLCCVLREQLKGMCETNKESCPTWSERKYSMAIRLSYLGYTLPGLLKPGFSTY